MRFRIVFVVLHRFKQFFRRNIKATGLQITDAQLEIRLGNVVLEFVVPATGTGTQQSQKQNER